MEFRFADKRIAAKLLGAAALLIISTADAAAQRLYAPDRPPLDRLAAMTSGKAQQARIKEMLDSAKYGAHVIVAARVSKVFGSNFSNGNHPKGIVTVEESFAGQAQLRNYEAIWPGAYDPYAVPTCGSTPSVVFLGINFSKIESDMKKQENDARPVPAPVVGQRIVLEGRLNASKMGIIDFTAYSPALIQAFRDGITGEQRQRTDQVTFWDNMDYARACASASDIIIANPQTSNTGKVTIVRRLKDSATAAAQGLDRPVYPEGKTWPHGDFAGPYKNGFIAFLNASDKAKNWTPSAGWPTIPPRGFSSVEYYEQDTFRFRPASSDNGYFNWDDPEQRCTWLIPVTDARVSKIMQAIQAKGR